MKKIIPGILLATVLAASHSALVQAAGAGGSATTSSGGTRAGATGSATVNNSISPGMNTGLNGSALTSNGAGGWTGNAGTSANAGGTGTAAGNWNTQNNYWRNNYPSSSYYNSSRNYSTYEPAYRYGFDLYTQNPGKSYNQLNQSQLMNGWTTARGSSNLDWSDAQLAARDAYNRMYSSNPNTAATAR